MASIKERLTAKVDRARKRSGVVDHVLSMVSHYGGVNGNAQAGAVTYFGFLSFFPVLALGFFVVGYVSAVYPAAQDQLVAALDDVLPGVVGSGEGEIPMSTFEDYAGAIGVIGLFGVLYTGLGWLSGMRDALEVMFKEPKPEQPNFIVGKGLDLLTLAVIGVIMIVSVALSGAVSGLSEQILVWVGVDPDGLVPYAILWLLAHGLAIAATTVLLLAMFRLLAQPRVRRPALVQGAVVGAVGFELLKALANFLIKQTQDQPAFQAFGVALILVVWINYFSRLVMYAAAWAYTDSEAFEQHDPAASPMPATAVTASVAPSGYGEGEGGPGNGHSDGAGSGQGAGPVRVPERSRTHRAARRGGPAVTGAATGVATGVAAAGAAAVLRKRRRKS